MQVQQAKRNLALETAAGPAQFPNYTAPTRNLPDPGATAVPLSGGMRAPWEPTRGQSLWNNKETEVETIRKDIEKVEIRESPYFSKNESPVKDKSVEVITIRDDYEDLAKETEEKKKLSLSDYKKRQMKIFDYVDSPAQQQRESIPASPTFVSPVRPRNIMKKNVVTPRKSLSNPVGQIIANHIQNTPKKNTVNSDDEVEDDLENSRYDNLNKPPCLDESEDEDDYYDVQEEQDANEEEDSKEDQAAEYDENHVNHEDDAESDENESEPVTTVIEKEEKVDDLTGLVKNFNFNSPLGSHQAANQQIEKTVEIDRKPPVNPENLLTENITGQHAESEVRTPNIHQLDTRQQELPKSGQRSEAKEQSQINPGEDKENKQPVHSKSANSGMFYRIQARILDFI